MRLPIPTLALIASILSVVTAKSSTGDRVLVVLESGIEKGDYSKFWKSLEARGYSLTFKSPKDDTAELIKYGERKYDHLIMYAPGQKTFSPALSPQSILHAQLDGLNTLYLLSPSLSPLNRDTFREYDLEFTDSSAGNTLISPFSSLASDPSSPLIFPAHSPLLSSSPANPVLSPSTLSGGPIVFPEAISHFAGETPYGFPILGAPRGSYVGGSGGNSNSTAGEGRKGGEVVLAGKMAGVVSAFQTRDNVRIGFVGSGKALSDKVWEASVEDQEGVTHRTANAAFAQDLTSWVFQETGVLRVECATHWSKTGGEVEKAEYRKNEEVAYSVSITQYSPSSGTYIPLVTPPSDLQLEFTMLDPFVRTPLILNSTASSAQGSTTYSASFRAPDRHGVFKFVVEYWRPGYTYLRSSTTTAVVPLRHDEHKRFITGAYPFYGATVSVSVAFVLFCGMWLGMGEERGRKKAE
ncbi:putative dolichyl-diphosphooligosaccharide--protein glycosyltransferase 48 kDa subunit precursor [Dioszegia hungarica]|uniref:Dolichyl-diphosphooligosaccharide--protein glycosyltransferase subunit WBP1 n=1 Tax=Dioszegia hungarica TaxID=4972 RepID=A0AA38H388_9TREE|nr:putative dolichyl-diphosphooligosaccharide--protein glycosyltransferase 48 kDa subunit precursor [Dioszegia hungarica]KAI9632901.1 putative dolichyl-diphosphooligosaccharide--protein glycosyltransferase 48 kDa subunit precursor [Dioszegia hungarica]